MLTCSTTLDTAGAPSMTAFMKVSQPVVAPMIASEVQVSRSVKSADTKNGK